MTPMNPDNKPNKKTVYVDVDEEITSVIDKVRSSKDSIVALVLPKRAAMFHSVVNMKLLKRAAEQDGKKTVLITSEPSILPIAGSVGLHVASNLTSKPYIPSAPDLPTSRELNTADMADPAIDPSAPIGSVLAKDKSEPSIEIDNRPKPDPAATASISSAAQKAKKKNGKKLSVPDFKKFRVLMIVGGLLLIFLAVFGYWALAIAPKATITLRGQTNDADLSFSFVADTDATSLDTEKDVVPSKLSEIKKTETEKAPATGQKDNGTKAGGTMTLKNCGKDNVTIPAGTGVSSGSLTYITQSSVKLGDANFDGNLNCKDNGSHTGTVNVVAQNNGDQFNSGPRTYTVASFAKVVGDGQAMTGGTSKISKVVSAGDVESAKQKIVARQQALKADLQKELEKDGFVGIVESFAIDSPKFTPTPAVDAEATEVTVSAETKYTMLGVDKEDMKKLIEKQADKEESIDVTKQSILSDGLGNAKFVIGNKKDSATDITVEAKVVAGPQIDQEGIRAEIAGKKRGEAEQILKARPGISEVRIDTKPFWNYSVPKKESKITFVIEESDGQSSN